MNKRLNTSGNGSFGDANGYRILCGSCLAAVKSSSEVTGNPNCEQSKSYETEEQLRRPWLLRSGMEVHSTSYLSV